MLFFIAIKSHSSTTEDALRFSISPFSSYTEEEICLAQNMYWEVRRQFYIAEMFNVGVVVLNRVKEKGYGSTICEVVKHSKYPGKIHRCQFSWYCDNRSDYPLIQEYKIFEVCIALSKTLLLINKYMIDYEGDFNKAVLYHAHTVTPPWNFDLLEVVRSDRFHIFYAYKRDLRK